MTSRNLLFVVAGLAAFLLSLAGVGAWQSSLYDDDWVAPHHQSSPPSFETDKLIQDFSYAGYRRSEVDLPQVMGPVFDVVADFGADPSGDTDTTGAIQDAIDAAADAGGGVVYLRAGTYRVSPPGDGPAALRIRSSNIVLRGAGPSQTFVFNDEWEMNRRDIIRVDAPGSGWSSVPDGSPVASIRSDLLSPTVEIPVESIDGFSAGDWIVLRADPTDDFKEEHNMGDLWIGQGVGPGVMFVRQILAIDESTNTVSIDVPIRYYLKTRDDARIHLAGPHIEEVGLEDFSIGNIEHPNHDSSTGWGTGDYNVEGTNANDVHGSYAVRLARVRNGWIRNVHTYRPEQNSLNAHVLSNGLRIGNSLAITVEDSHFQRALYAGGGGNAYMVRITNAQEVLVKNTVVGYNRHGFVFSHMQTSGNVIHGGRAEHTRWRAIPGNAGSSGSDHHMWLSQSNLVDNTQLLQDYFAAFFRGTWGSNHGQTAVHSVFWNLEGLEYNGGRDHIVNTEQARYGYAIGTRGPAPGISTSGTSTFSDEAWRADPVDHVEGEGQGDTLEPRSLFAHQLRNRILGDEPSGRVAMPEISPQGGTYYEARVIHLSSQTEGAQIHFTLDGTAPSLESPRYEDPLLLDGDVNLRAIAYAHGMSESRIATGEFRFPDEDCLLVTDAWQSTPTSAQSGQFEFEFRATPGQDEMNAVMGLSHGDAGRYQDLAVIARFSPDGVIDARHGGDYDALQAVPYEGGTSYEFRFVVDIATLSYDLFVGGEGIDGEVAVAEDFDFRTEQSQVYRLDRFSAFAAVGENEICQLFNPADLPADEEEPNGDDTGHTPGSDEDASEGSIDVGDAGVGGAESSESGCGCSQGSQNWPSLVFFIGLLLLLLAGPVCRRYQRLVNNASEH